MDLQEFQFTITHRPGKLNANADALSRLKVQVQDIQDQSNAISAAHEHSPSPIPHTLLTCTQDPEGKRTSSDKRPESCAVTLNPTIDLKQAQRLDSVLAQLIQFKNAGRNKPAITVWANDPRLKQYWYQYDRLFLKDGILVRSVARNSPTPRYAIAIPQALILEILKGVHDSPFAGHLGVTRTENRIRERFYWPGIRPSVEHYVKACPTCAQTKANPNMNKAPLQSIAVGEPFSFWAIDYMGPLPDTPSGNRHLLVIMDHFTKWCEAIPTKDQKASTVAPLLVNKTFSRFGPPVVLHSDQGANF